MPGPRTIDLNADVGESFGRWRLGDDEALLDVVTSANVACGFHAGDPATLVASSAKARAELGWVPEKPTLQAMIGDAWTFYQAHVA